MDVFGVGEDRFTSHHVLAAGNDLTAVVQNGMSDGGGIHRKGDAVHETVTSAQTRKRSFSEARSKSEGMTY